MGETAEPGGVGEQAHNARMEDLDADRILDDYIDRHPAAQMGLRDDPVFHAQMHWFKQTLDLLEPALYREGLHRAAVVRVVNTIVYGVPDPDTSIMRMAEARVDLAEAMAATPCLVLDEEAVKHLFGNGNASQEEGPLT